MRGFVLPCFLSSSICIWRWVHSCVWMPKALAWSPEWEQACFPFTHSVNPSTSLNITCQQSRCVPVAASLSILMSHGGFFRLVGRNDALHGHMLDLFSVVFEQVTAGFSYWLNPQFKDQTAPRKLKNSSFPARPCCDCMRGLVLRFVVFKLPIYCTFLIFPGIIKKDTWTQRL